MKKLILALLAVSTVGVASAQKNSVLVYGTMGLSYDKTDNGGGTENRSLDWNVSPGVGYQFTNNITLGLQGGIWSMFDENRMSPAANTWNRNAMETREWQAGVFFRYTKPVSNWISLFAQVDLSYVSGQDVSEAETRAVDVAANKIVETLIYGYDYYNGFQATVTPMVQIFVYDGMALNFGFGGLGYRTTSYDTPKSPTALNGAIDQSSFMVTWGNQFNFGVSKNFKCKTRTGNVKPGDDLRPMKIEADEDDE
ncbi:MAG TPA: outer membrane beta-barrel protein [Flavipsychrobacter sp.]